MISNYFTLLHIAKLLHKRYARTVIAQIYSQEKNTLSILLYTPEAHTITVSCNARENYIVAKSGDSRSRMNSVDLFPELIDKHIESVYISATDRIVYFKTKESTWLCLEMFASKANAVLCDESGMIINAFLKKKELISLKRDLQHSAEEITIKDILPSTDIIQIESIKNNSDKRTVIQTLKQAVPKLGTTLATEIIFQSPNNNNDIEATADILIQRLLTLSNISPIVYFEENSPVCFSLVPLEHLASYRTELYDDLFIGIQKFISFGRSTSTFLQKKKAITSWLTKESEKTERTIRSVESELAEASRAEQYELFANLIMAHLPSIIRGTKSATVENSFSQQEIVTIPLDVSLSPQRNAERYFEKAKKAKNAREESHNRLVVLKQRMKSLSDLLEKSNHINDSFSLKNFLQSYGGMVKELGFMTEKEQEELPPFKIFVVEGGFTVFAGKNSANNDLLTFKFAKPNDLWFHSRGSSGSHVVLKIGSAQGTPTKKAIEQAASIAAYYSKMKNAKHVPVAMTERKYIHKPKGAPAGTVTLDKEKVIFVQPVLPGKEL